jgi:serine/threonine-protein kinase
MTKLPEADRKQLPDDVVQTAEDLYSRALDLARTLNEMDQSFGSDTPERVRQKLDLAQLKNQGEERDRHVRLLEQQLKTATDLADRRDKIAGRLESSVLAMQNMRYDLMRLRTAGVGAVLNDLTSATLQARAISRDVDHMIAAVSEVREAMG